MTPDAPANGTGNSASHLQLAALLRECANYIERNEFHPDMYQALGQLHAYTGQHSSGEEHRQVSTTTPKTSTTMDPIHVMSSLGKGLKKGLGLEPQHKARHNPSAAQATSSKNAERAMSDLGDMAKKAERGHRSTENDWCNEHFCLGCACKDHLKTSTSGASSTEHSFRSLSPGRDPSAVPPVRDTSRVNVTTTSTSRPAKPSFQRPTNPNSILIANGWIEQQRRSKMRVVWKDVLASLVEGRKPGEETTLWIQRETTNPLTGKPELEALHQIPMKWLVSIEYLDYSTDYRFALKVHNVSEEFLFKCADQESAQNWVLTLRSVREITLKDTKGNNPPKGEVEEWGETTVASGEQMEAPSREPEPDSHRMAIHELRAIAHGAGINTAGMERKELEAAVANIARSAQSDTAKEDHHRREEELKRKQEMEVELRRRQAAAAHAAEEAEKHRRMTEENRRIAEDNERRRKVAEEEEHRVRLEQEHHRRQLAEEEQRRRQLAEEEQRRRQLAEEEQRRRQLAEEEQRRRQQAEEELRRRQQADEAQRIEEMRRRKLAEEEQRRRATEEEQRRRAAEQQAAEQRRRQEEAQRQWQQQQRQQAAEQQTAEQRRREEEAQRQQQWQQQQQRQQQQQQWQQRQPPPQKPPPQNWQQQQRPTPPQQQPFYGGARAASPVGHAPPPPPRGQGPTSSPVNLKYAKMAAQNDDGGQATMTAIKHNILIHWALQPPMLQMLRPIDVLISTIHTVFPPVFGVAGHEYFGNWRAVKREDLIGPGNIPVDEKLKKGVRKLRFFLHPDKLPRDLTDEQVFMCKMLWDITSDAWDDFQKHKEELDWIRT